MRIKINYKFIFFILFVCALLFVFFYINTKNNIAHDEEFYSHSSFAMSTIVTQEVYGENAQKAALEVENAFVEFEKTLSLYDENSDISKINNSSGENAVVVSQLTLELLKQAQELSLKEQDGFALTLAPLSLAWGFTSDNPQVLSEEEINAMLPLVDDAKLFIDEENSTVMLLEKGQAIDLGAIAKGAACAIAKQIYIENNIESAVISIGGNVFIHGQKPDGTNYKVGFRDPNNSEISAIASVELKDSVFAVSGGYERFFEENGEVYHHILDPTTGKPSNSDILTVGIIHKDGAIADFYSTTLFVQGKEKAIEYFKNGGTGMFLDKDNVLYVSSNLKSSLNLFENSYNIVYI